MSSFNLGQQPPQLPPLVEKPPSILWTGFSGRVYALEIHPIGSNYYARPGVYIFCKRNLNGNWDACYVGETDSFARRLTTDLAVHHRWQSIRTAGSTHICTLHVPGDSTLRLSIETDLRRALNPSCNRQ